MNNSTSQSDSKFMDLVIIGGGPAGMSAALVAGRGLLNTVVINSESPCNAVTRASHGFLSRDGIHPLELLKISKEQLEKYQTVDYVKDSVIGIEQFQAGFKVETHERKTFLTKRVMFATGLVEKVTSLGIKGLEAVYGKSIYPCPFCDGWEHRNQQLALFGNGEWIAEFAKTVSHWSDDLIVFTNGDPGLSADMVAALEEKNIRVESTLIDFLDHTQGKLEAVVLQDGRRIKREAGFLLDTAEQQATSLPAKLGVGQSDSGTYEADNTGKTAREGIYIIGDRRTGFNGLVAAAAEGSLAAEMIVHEVIKARWI